MTWDVTVTDTLAELYLATTSTVAGAAAGAASRKEIKCQSLASTHAFIPIAFETLGPINAKGITFSTSLVTAFQLKLANREKQHFFFSVFPSLSNALTASAFMVALRNKQNLTPTPKPLRHILF